MYIRLDKQTGRHKCISVTDTNVTRTNKQADPHTCKHDGVRPLPDLAKEVEQLTNKKRGRRIGVELANARG
jgi:hypothetical protein